MKAELPEDISDTAFINQRVSVHDGLLLSGDDIRLVNKRDLGIRDDGGREKSMGMAAMAADYSADMEEAGRKALPDGTMIITVNREAGGVTAARTSELMELEGKNEIIVKRLCQGVA